MKIYNFLTELLSNYRLTISHSYLSIISRHQGQKFKKKDEERGKKKDFVVQDSVGRVFVFVT